MYLTYVSLMLTLNPFEQHYVHLSSVFRQRQLNFLLCGADRSKFLANQNNNNNNTDFTFKQIFFTIYFSYMIFFF